MSRRPLNFWHMTLKVYYVNSLKPTGTIMYHLTLVVVINFHKIQSGNFFLFLSQSVLLTILQPFVVVALLPLCFVERQGYVKWLFNTKWIFKRGKWFLFVYSATYIIIFTLNRIQPIENKIKKQYWVFIFYSSPLSRYKVKYNLAGTLLYR